MDKESFFYKLEKEIQDEIIKLLPSNIDNQDIFYETAIQYLISLSHIYDIYDDYALKLSIENHEKKTCQSFVETIEKMQKNKDINGRIKPLIHSEFYSFIIENKEIIENTFNKIICQTNSFKMNYFGWKTLMKSYLIKTHQGIVERIDHMWFRIALFLHTNNFENVEKTFTLLRTGQAIHATPTLFHAGLVNPQMASCFLLGTEDSVKGIYKTISDAATISKHAGGIGIHITNIRGKNSYIYGTNGYSSGIMPMLKVYNDTSRYIDQCFEPSTLIVTSRGIIPISKIVPYQDQVLTHDGTFQKVLKKLTHVVDKDIIKLKIETPWKDIVSFMMTNKHDMYWLNTVTNQKEYLPVEKAGFGFKTIYIDPKEINSNFYENELSILGFLYANLKYDANYIWKLIINKDHLYLKLIKIFLERYYKDNYQINYMEENLEIIINMANNTSIIDTELLKTNDFPFQYCLESKQNIQKFYKGYMNEKNELAMTNHISYSKLLFMKYRQKNNDLGDIISMEILQDKKHILYDLEIENNHNYQTLLGLAHNGGGKRKGAFAMYIEPWHSDIFDFIFARRNIGNEEERARDLFFGLWIPDEFMKRVEKDEDWYLMSENDCPGLSKVWGQKFVDLYESFITQNKYVRKIKARELWNEILKSQIETGNPYILYKDTCNRFSNQQNLGTIRSSNLCCEIIEYSDENEYAVCNLASISLPSCIKYKDASFLNFWIYGRDDCIYCNLLKGILDERKISYKYLTSLDINNLTLEEKKRVNVQKSFPIVYEKDKHIGGFQETWERFLRPEFNFQKLGSIIGALVENLNIVIDKNSYPLEECKRSNFKNRPIGLGITGLADVFMEMLEPYDSEFSRCLNKKIFETMYYYALKSSHELALKFGPYQTFNGSPLSRGILHFEQYNQFNKKQDLSIEYDWENLRKNIMEKGVRNSLLIAPMPTASTSQILGNTESFEPLTSNFYVRRTLAGEFYVINKYLRKFLTHTNLWNEDYIHSLGVTKGSVQMLDLPLSIKNVFKTVWEIPQKNLIEMAADRQMFIDQSQSLNIYLSKADPSILTKIHFYGWKKQLKTGCYYLRTRAAISSQNFAIDPSKEKDICISCSS